MMTAEILYEAAGRIEGVERLRPSSGSRIELAPGEVRRLIAVHDRSDATELTVELGEGARLQLVELFTSEAFRTLKLRQQGGSTAEVTILQLGSANLDCTVDLDGPGAESRVNGLFLAADGDRCEFSLRTNHNVSDCRSESLVKGVAGGKSTGEFRGLVYVAPDAQRTDARQTSRNIELGDEARIVTKPQLEIYADDVKCSHGATVGQLDGEAILYMRQRGLSDRQARRLQIEGFAADVAGRCAVEEFAEPLLEAVAAQLEKM